MASLNLLGGLTRRTQSPSANNAKPQSNTQLFQSSTTSLTAATQTITVNNIKNPNGYAAHNIIFDLNITDTTSTTVPSGVNAVNSAYTSFQVIGASGRQLLNIQPNSGDPFERLQHRLNLANGMYNTSPTPADSATSTTYSSDYIPIFHDWVIYPEEFPLEVKFTLNTLSSRATTLNSMTSTAQVTMYADFVPLARALPRTILRVKPVTGIAAANFDFGTYLDAAPLIDVSVDAGADTNISASNSINVAVNNNALISNTAYQSVINREDYLYSGISSPHIGGFFPLNVLNGMPVLNPRAEKDTVEFNFSSQPSASGTTGQANLYMIEVY